MKGWEWAIVFNGLVVAAVAYWLGAAGGEATAIGLIMVSTGLILRRIDHIERKLAVRIMEKRDEWGSPE